MSGQFEWVDDRPKLRAVPVYAADQHEHDQHPIWPKQGHVPGTRRPSRSTMAARLARETADAMIQGAILAGPQVQVGDCLIPTDSTEQEDGTTIDLPDDEPSDLDYDQYPEMLHDARWDER